MLGEGANGTNIKSRINYGWYRVGVIRNSFETPPLMSRDAFISIRGNNVIISGDEPKQSFKNLVCRRGIANMVIRRSSWAWRYICFNRAYGASVWRDRYAVTAFRGCGSQSPPEPAATGRVIIATQNFHTSIQGRIRSFLWLFIKSIAIKLTAWRCLHPFLCQAIFLNWGTLWLDS